MFTISSGYYSPCGSELPSGVIPFSLKNLLGPPLLNPASFYFSQNAISLTPYLKGNFGRLPFSAVVFWPPLLCGGSAPLPLLLPCTRVSSLPLSRLSSFILVFCSLTVTDPDVVFFLLMGLLNFSDL